MNAPPALQHFVDEELLRAPLLFEQALDALLAQWQSGRVELMPAERAAVAELPRRLLAQRPLLVDAYVRSLRTQTAAELSGRRAAPLDALATGTALSLVDEDEVAVEIGLARTIETVKSVADHELRELLTYTSALAGDMDVARDHNPLRAETQARALWAAAQMLPAERGVRAAFMRHAGLPLAQSLRKAFASACARLETTGIEPATYRTLILPPGARRPRRNDTTVIPELGQLRQALPVPEPPLISLFLTDAADPQRAALLTRLFDVILASRRLPADVGLLISRLQPCALRAISCDPATLEDYDHPLWRTVDRLAFLAETLPANAQAERSRWMTSARHLVGELAQHARPDAALFDAALGQLDDLEAHRLELRCQAAGARIEALQRLEDRLAAAQASPATLAGALDFQQLDTVPASLLDALAPAAGTSAPGSDASQHWLAQRRPGEWLRLFMHGQWTLAQLLWPGCRGEVWLLANAEATAYWAMRRRALLVLHTANLIEVAASRSLVRDAAKQVKRQLRAAVAG